MKRTIGIVLILTLILVCFAGCNGNDVPVPDTGPIAQTIHLDDGVISWEPVEGAACYEVDFGGGAKQIRTTYHNIARECGYIGMFDIQVSAVYADGNRAKIGNIEVETRTLENTSIRIEQKDNVPYFAWDGAENVRSYTYHAFDGAAEVTAKADADGVYRVPVTDTFEQLFYVVAHGKTEDNVVRLDRKTYFQYASTDGFDMTNLVKYPIVYTSSGAAIETFTVATALPEGRWTLDVTMYVMDSKGRTLQGNGQWGRRVANENWDLWWLCDTAPSATWPKAEGTLPGAAQAVTNTIVANVDKNGNATMRLCDWKRNEMLVLVDMQLYGKTVLSVYGGTYEEPPADEDIVVSLEAYAGWGDNFIPFNLSSKSRAALDRASWFSDKDTSGYYTWTKFSGNFIVNGKTRQGVITINAGKDLIIGEFPDWKDKTITIVLPKDSVFTIYQVGNGGGTLANGGTVRFDQDYTIQVNDGAVSLIAGTN